MAIYLIRHGETAANAARVMQLPQTPLSERGARQAERLARRLADAGIGHILSSDLRGAEMTAARLARATGVAVELDARLQERNFGELRGRPYAELGLDPFAQGYTPPGGESWDAFHARVDRAWSRIAEAAPRAPGHLAVVTHGLVCFSLVSRVLEAPAGDSPPMRFGNTSLTIVAGEPPWRIERLDCTAHLDEDTADGTRSRENL